MRPDPSTHNPAPAYVQQLLDRAGLAPDEAGPAIGVTERTVRSWLLGERRMPYTAQFALESLRPARK